MIENRNHPIKTTERKQTEKSKASETSGIIIKDKIFMSEGEGKESGSKKVLKE